VRGDEVAFVWLTTWDTAGDARQFADAVGSIGLDALVQTHDARVLVIGAPDAAALAPRVWARSTFSPEA
jgi:hypothetical protein